MFKITLICCLCFGIFAAPSATFGNRNSSREFEYEVIVSGRGYGYNILKYGAVYIHQPFVPALQGFNVFKTKEAATLIAVDITKKLQSHNYQFLTEKDALSRMFYAAPGKSQWTIKQIVADDAIARSARIQAARAKLGLPDLPKLYEPPLKSAWRKIGEVPFGNRSGAMSFVIDGRVFVGGGENKDITTRDFWCYDPANNFWTCLQELPGGPRISGVTFAISGFGYLGLGGYRGGLSKTFKNDLYRYDPRLNTWQRKSDFPGGGRVDAVCFVIGSKAYAGLGFNTTYFSDMYCYDPTGERWTRIRDFAGGGVSAAIGISTSGHGFVLCGDNRSQNRKFFYEYLPETDGWQRKADFPGAARYFLTGFGLDNDQLIAGAGGSDGGEKRFRDFYIYTISSGRWAVRPDYPVSRAGNSRLAGGSVDGTVFMGIGYNGQFLNDWNAFEEYFSVRLDTGIYDESVAYPLKYRGTWELYQECSGTDRYTGIGIKTNERLGDFYYSSYHGGRIHYLTLHNKDIVSLLPRVYCARTAEQPKKKIGVRLYYTRNELAALSAGSDPGGSAGLDKMVIICSDLDKPANHFPVSADKIKYRVVNPKWYRYGADDNMLVAEFTMDKMNAHFFLAVVK